MNLVFVYGTLKQGFPNFSVNEGKRYKGVFETQCAFPLYLVGERFTPWLVLSKGQGMPIKGEVYAVNKATLASMDLLEKTAEPDGYRRVITRVICQKTNEQLDVFVYGKAPELLENADVRQTLEDEYTPEHAELYARRA